MDVVTRRPSQEKAFRAVIWACDLPAITLRASYSIRSILNWRLSRFEKCDPTAPMVWVSREYGNIRNGRHINNEDAIIKYIKESSFKRFKNVVVMKGTEDLATKQKMVRRSCMLVGEHGTGLYHFIWMSNDAAVLELDGFNMYTIFWTYATSLGLMGDLNIYHP